MSDGYEYFTFDGSGLHSPGDEVYEPVGNPNGWRSMGDLEPFSKGRIYRRKVNPNVRLESKEQFATQQHAQNWLKIQPFLRDLLDNSEVNWLPTHAIAAAYAGFEHRTSWRVLLRSLFANIEQPKPKIEEFIAAEHQVPSDHKGPLYVVYVDGKLLCSSKPSVTAHDLLLFGKNSTGLICEQIETPVPIDPNSSLVLQHKCRSFFTKP